MGYTKGRWQLARSSDLRPQRFTAYLGLLEFTNQNSLKFS